MAGGLGAPQQLAALANAIAESNLDPNAALVAERAVGLFQLNMAHGLGRGHTAAEQGPRDQRQSYSVRSEKFGAFKSADSLEDAVSAFVRNMARPASPAAQIAHRLRIAEQIGSVG
jgi:hypothetical protein